VNSRRSVEGESVAQEVAGKAGVVGLAAGATWFAASCCATSACKSAGETSFATGAGFSSVRGSWSAAFSLGTGTGHEAKVEAGISKSCTGWARRNSWCSGRIFAVGDIVAATCAVFVFLLEGTSNT
jgi:hypothetical protein